jgi:hypothetical protein
MCCRRLGGLLFGLRLRRLRCGVLGRLWSRCELGHLHKRQGLLRWEAMEERDDRKGDLGGTANYSGAGDG